MSPAVALPGMAPGDPWADVSLKSLVRLALLQEPTAYPGLIHELRARISCGVDLLRHQKEASLSCTWLYRRSFILNPQDCDGRIPLPLEFRIEHHGIGIEGAGAICVDGLPDGLRGDRCDQQANQKDWTAFFEALRSRNLSDYIDDSEISRDHSGDSRTYVYSPDLPAGLLLESDGSLYFQSSDPLRRQAQAPSWAEAGAEADATADATADAELEDAVEGPQLLGRFVPDWQGSGDGPIRRLGSQWIVPVAWVEEIDVRHQVAMGELGELLGLGTTDDSLADWPSRLAQLLVAQQSDQGTNQQHSDPPLSS